MIDNDQDIIKSINIYLENVNNSLVLVEVNEPIRQIEIIESIKNEIKDKNILEVDLLNTKLNHLEKVQECIKNDTKNSEIVLVTNLHQISNKIENNITDNELVRDLNFSREPYAKLKKVIVFFLPVYFVDLVIRNAPDFYDFLSVKFRFKSENKISDENISIPIDDDIDERYVKNRINFLESILENYGDIDANYIKNLIDLSINYALLGHTEKSKKKLQSILSIVDETYNSEIKIQILLTLSTLEFSLGNYIKSIEFCENAYDIYIKYDLDNQNFMSRIFASLGRNYLKIGNYPKSIEYINKSINLFRKEKDYSNLIRSLFDLFDFYTINKRYEDSLDLSDELLELTLDYDINYNFSTLNRIYNVYILLNKLDIAIKFIESYYNENKSKLLKVSNKIKQLLSRLYILSGDFEKGLNIINEILKSENNTYNLSYSFYTKGLLNKKNGRYTESILDLNEALKYINSTKKSNLINKGIILLELSKIYYEMNQLYKSIDYSWSSFDIFSLIEHSELNLLKSLDLLGKCYYKLGKLNKYNNVLKKELAISFKLNKNIYIEIIFVLAKFFYYEKKDFYNSINYLQKGLKVFNELESPDYKIKILDLLIKNYEKLKDDKNIIKYKNQLDLLLKEPKNN